MRYDVKKILFVGTSEERDRFFRKAQEFGCIHFIDIHRRKFQEFPPEVQDLLTAIKIVRKGSSVEPQKKGEADPIVARILALEEASRSLEEKIGTLNQEIEKLKGLGQMSLEDIRAIEKEGYLHLQFFQAPKEKVAPELLEGCVVRVGTDTRWDYFMSMNREKMAYEKMTEIAISRSLEEVEEELAQSKREQVRVEEALKREGRFSDCLHQALVQKLNLYHLSSANQIASSFLDHAIFAVEGWVPVHKMAMLPPLLQGMSVYMEEVAIQPQDSIPTFLENEGVAKIGEDLVHIYDVPSTTDKDPSWWVLGGFALFFGMIVGDAGYGLVFLLLSLYLRHRFSEWEGVKRRILNLSLILSMSCIVWGVLMTSFFSAPVPLDHPIRKVSLIQWLVQKKVAYHLHAQDEEYRGWLKQYPQVQGVKDPAEALAKGTTEVKGREVQDLLDQYSRSIMFEMALFVGAVHLSLSLMRSMRRNRSQVGWLLFLWGCYLYFPYYLGATSMIHYVFHIDPEKGGKIGLWCMGGGLSLAMFFAILKDRLLGVTEVMNVIQIFGDVMSYLRLYALALAGSIVSITINEIAVGLPFILGVLLLMVAHTINMVLGVMGGVIHGLRLNFLEWYRYSFEGKGHSFKPLQLLKFKKNKS